MIGTLINLSQEFAISFHFAGSLIERGLYCGACFDAWIGGCWLPTRIERINNKWHLIGVNGVKLAGLMVRV